MRDGKIVIVILPGEDAELPSICTGHCRYVRLPSNTLSQHHIERHRMIAFNLESTPAHAAKHSKYVEHRFVDAVAGQRPEPSEVRLILELKRPGQRTLQMHAVFFGQFLFASVAG